MKLITFLVLLTFFISGMAKASSKGLPDDNPFTESSLGIKQIDQVMKSSCTALTQTAWPALPLLASWIERGIKTCAATPAVFPIGMPLVIH